MERAARVDVEKRLGQAVDRTKALDAQLRDSKAEIAKWRLQAPAAQQNADRFGKSPGSSNEPKSATLGAGDPDRVWRIDTNCHNLTEIQIPPGIKKVNLHGCQFLTSLEGLPDSVEVLDCSICLRLPSLNGIPEGVRILDVSGSYCVNSFDGLPRNLEELHCYPIYNGISFERHLKAARLSANVRVYTADRPGKTPGRDSSLPYSLPYPGIFPTSPAFNRNLKGSKSPVSSMRKPAGTKFDFVGTWERKAGGSTSTKLTLDDEGSVQVARPAPNERTPNYYEINHGLLEFYHTVNGNRTLLERGRVNWISHHEFTYMPIEQGHRQLETFVRYEP
jgi:hypothetical protein